MCHVKAPEQRKQKLARNLTYLKKHRIQEIQTEEATHQNEKCSGALHEDLLRNLKGFDQRPSAGEKVTVLFEPLYMYDLSFISALRMTFSYFSTKSL